MWKKITLLAVPVLFAVYPVLSVISGALGQIPISQALRSLVISILFALGLTLLLRLVFRQPRKASLLSICWLILFYSYGQVHAVLFRALGPQIGRHALLLPLTAILGLGSALWIWKTRADLSRALSFFGWMAVLLMGMVSFPFARYYLPLFSGAGGQPAASTAAPAVPAGGKPDVYYIILDGYARQDILQELYTYDNSEFIKFLQGKGFFVAGSSHSNYMQTTLSLSSSLNMESLDTIGLPSQDSTVGRRWLQDKIAASRVFQLFKDQGYHLLTFEAGPAEQGGDEVVYENFDTTPQAVEIKRKMRVNEFEGVFLSTTLLKVAVDLNLLNILDTDQLYSYHYAQTQYIFNMLGDIPDLPGNYFVYAHVMAPHPPFVFGDQGRFVHADYPFSLADGSTFPGTLDDYISGYRDNVAYVDAVLEREISRILANSDPAPIIILQGDHGPGAYLDWKSANKTNLDERLSILNAYYFPGNHTARLYPGITPVNSFRVLFNEYFGMNFPLLPDKSYFSTWTKPFSLIDVTDRLKK